MYLQKNVNKTFRFEAHKCSKTESKDKSLWIEWVSFAQVMTRLMDVFVSTFCICPGRINTNAQNKIK